MLTRLKRLLGWEAPPSVRRQAPRNRPAAKAAGRANSGRPETAAAGPAVARDRRTRPSGQRDIADILDNPSLSLDTSDEQNGFDPYSTGVFDRGASWDRISKNSR